ncbi:MAG: hypothetical protein CFH18_00968 [Alphaproteobacteria bacterium MarineAlpha5_Bin8]|nr:MAG: hypothetical protein CFH18_00968 [Alphaproteobacteria bacterium MarineAlpha5_Bin8]PPR45922.1 MAG: hypothetical protein CFH17_00204 [Alphaproteobacteria bacterium MarineAlpha5_Bin7]PPR54080.1 MAG: hypothetical protein CFH16_00640 [Alphaproteobacteria bacterium MarineAlpha5_Bin6]|tara:strand:- start:1081 stop:1941 length:861 start_codon:yes stop_codon:yes gene_type:complete
MIFKKIHEAEKFNFAIIKAKLINTEGSVPRNEGTIMLISKKYIFGSIGGGQLEYSVIQQSLNILNNNQNFKERIINIPLGPSIGQCCGGYVQVKLSKHKDGKESFKNEQNINNIKDNLYIFGAGHIGKELSYKFIDLDFNINLIDSRKEYLQVIKNENIINIYAKLPWLLIKSLPKDSFFIILTHSHDYDFKIINEILKINKFKFIGLIGSKTKMKRFKNRFLKLGHNESLIKRIECPIGIKSISSKKPGEIAISIIARILEYRSKLLLNANNEKNIFNFESVNGK